MTLYCTTDDLITRFGETEIIQLTSKESPIDAINYDVLNLAISDASAEIDGYLARFSLPLVSVPKTLTRICCDIARYFLYDDSTLTEDHPVDKRYKAVIKFLEQVSKGTISLGVDDTGNTPESSDTAIMESGGRVFSRSDKGFI